MNLLKQLLFGKGPDERLAAEITRLLGQEPTPAMMTEIRGLATSLTADLLGPKLARHRPRILLAFARQTIDGTERLKSSHWSSGGGRNVGHEVLMANGRALRVTQTVLGAARPRDRSLNMILAAIDELVTQQRSGPGDEDGYGLGTLHELRRDLGAIPSI